ncbi:MAG: fibrillarin-like rRNA/tRNA 2'-O-methyltransferase [Candidatus Thermoplasmatota archaeon]|nr:fibrillarin-like rRNA/tRNA 2'-O-methyltransferase [Candidatus Thermoplasmatota archaeon]
MDRIAFKDGKIYTLDMKGGSPVYGEEIIEIEGKKFREWIPWRSKLAALIRRMGGHLPQLKGPVLYLGAAQGTTVTHISDLLPDSVIYAVEFSPTAYRKLASIARERGNIVPILEDAFHPEKYLPMVGRVNTLYQDVSQKDQVGMFIKNADMMLAGDGIGYLMLKARSVDVTSDPGKIFEEAASILGKKGWSVMEVVELDPFQKDHACLIICR